MREKGTDFSIARTRYTVNKQKFLQHPMVKRISALAEDEQRKGCRPGDEGKTPPGTAHLMQKRALIAMQYSALHHRTWKTPTVQKPCRKCAKVCRAKISPAKQAVSHSPANRISIVFSVQNYPVLSRQQSYMRYRFYGRV